MLEAPASRPSATYEEAVERAGAIAARDDDRVLPEGRTALLTSGARAPLAVVLFHGFTNHPGQYAQFAPLLAERGVNVFAPRMWGHGYRDRMSRDLERFDMGKGLAGAYEARDAASGLGDRVAVLGISLGGVLAAHIAQHRADVALAVPIAPDIAILNFPYPVSRGAGMATFTVRRKRFSFGRRPDCPTSRRRRRSGRRLLAVPIRRAGREWPWGGP